MLIPNMRSKKCSKLPDFEKTKRMNKMDEIFRSYHVCFESDIEDSLLTLFRINYKDIIEAYGLEKVLDP